MNNYMKISLMLALVVTAAAFVMVVDDADDSDATTTYSAKNLYQGGSQTINVEPDTIVINDVTEGTYTYEASNNSFTIRAGQTVSVTINLWQSEVELIGTVTISFVGNTTPPVTTYTVYFSAGTGGSVNQSSITNVPSGATISVSGNRVTINGTTVTATSNYGYVFSSWSNISGTITSNRTITANFSQSSPTYYTCYLNYNANGGIGAPSQQSYTGTSTANHTFYVSTTVPTRDGYTFMGWSTSSTATSASYHFNDPISVGYNSTVTLYAVWQQNTCSLTLYTPFNTSTGSVYYTANGGTRTLLSSSVTLTLVQGSGQVMIEAVAANGCSFVEWSVDYPALEDQATLTNSTETITYTSLEGQNAEIRPYFAVLYTCYLAYNANGGTGAPSTQSYTGTSTSDHTFYVSTTVPTRAGYTFMGWSTSSTATTATYHFNDPVSVGYNSTVTLYAVWQQNTCNLTIELPTDPSMGSIYYTVNGGTRTLLNANVTLTIIQNSSQVIIEAIPATGFVFQNWVVEYPDLEEQGDDWTSATTTVTYATLQGQNTDVRPVFSTVYTCYLVYSANGGTGAPASESYSGLSTEDHTFTISSTTPTRSGYTFMGWSTSSTATSASYQPGNSISVPHNGTTTLYAVWFQPTPTYDEVYWSNNLYNGSVELTFSFSSGTNMTHLMTIPLYSGTVGERNETTWTATGYTLQIGAVYSGRNATITASILNPVGTTILQSSQNMGSWHHFQLTINAVKGELVFTPIDSFTDFTDFNAMTDQSRTVLTWSSVTNDNATFEITHDDLGTGGGRARFAVTNTDTFLNTFGVVMNDPSINVFDYFPQYDSIRLNLYSFAIYGESMTINGHTWDVTNGSVTIYYTTQNRINTIASPGDEGAESRTMTLSNIFITWEDGDASLTFADERGFTVELGAFEPGNETVSFSGLWYFTAFLNEPYTVTEKHITGDWGNLPTIGTDAILLLFLGVLLITGLIAHVKLGLKWLDMAIVICGAIVLLTLLG